MWQQTAPQASLLGDIWSRYWPWVWWTILSFLICLRSTGEVGLSWNKWAGWSCCFCQDGGKGRSQLCASSAVHVFCPVLSVCNVQQPEPTFDVFEGRGRPREAYLTHLTPKIRTFKCHVGISNELRFGEAALLRFALRSLTVSPLLSLLSGVRQEFLCAMHTLTHKYLMCLLGGIVKDQQNTEQQLLHGFNKTPQSGAPRAQRSPGAFPATEQIICVICCWFWCKLWHYNGIYVFFMFVIIIYYNLIYYWNCSFQVRKEWLTHLLSTVCTAECNNQQVLNTCNSHQLAFVNYPLNNTKIGDFN